MRDWKRQRLKFDIKASSFSLFSFNPRQITRNKHEEWIDFHAWRREEKKEASIPIPCTQAFHLSQIQGKMEWKKGSDGFTILECKPWYCVSIKSNENISFFSRLAEALLMVNKLEYFIFYGVWKVLKTYPNGERKTCTRSENFRFVSMCVRSEPFVWQRQCDSLSRFITIHLRALFTRNKLMDLSFFYFRLFSFVSFSVAKVFIVIIKQAEEKKEM